MMMMIIIITTTLVKTIITSNNVLFVTYINMLTQMSKGERYYSLVK